MDQPDTRALFSALATELAGRMDTVESLSSLAAEHARQTPADRRSAVLVKAQAIDDLHQTLDSLRAFAGALSGGVSIHNALAGIPLADLADRLQGRAPAAEPETSGRSGDLVLFD